MAQGAGAVGFGDKDALSVEQIDKGVGIARYSGDVDQPDIPNDKVGITGQRMLECVMNNSETIVGTQTFNRLSRFALEFDRGGRKADGLH